MAINHLAGLYRTQGKYDVAGPLFTKVLQGWRGLSGADSTQVAKTLADLGFNLLQQKKYTEAEPLLRESLAISEQKFPDHWTRFNAQSLLGGSLAGQEKYADAEQLLLAGYHGMKGREKTIPAMAKPQVIKALERIVNLYEAWGKPEQATASRVKRPQPAISESGS